MANAVDEAIAVSTPAIFIEALRDALSWTAGGVARGNRARSCCDLFAFRHAYGLEFVVVCLVAVVAHWNFRIHHAAPRLAFALAVEAPRHPPTLPPCDGASSVRPLVLAGGRVGLLIAYALAAAGSSPRTMALCAYALGIHAFCRPKDWVADVCRAESWRLLWTHVVGWDALAVPSAVVTHAKTFASLACRKSARA